MRVGEPQSETRKETTMYIGVGLGTLILILVLLAILF